jgi:hypothetical protein
VADVAVVGSPYDFGLTKNARNQSVTVKPRSLCKAAIQICHPVRLRWSGGAERGL